MAKFKPGVSGNPGGKPRDVMGVQELCRRWTPQVVQVFARIVRDRKAPAAARVSAGLALLDRGWGRPASFSTTDPSAFKRAVELSDEELIRIAQAGGIALELPVPREAKSPADYPQITPGSSSGTSSKQYQ